MHLFESYDGKRTKIIGMYDNFKDANGVMDNPDVIDPNENTVTFVEPEYFNKIRDERSNSFWTGLDLGAAIAALGAIGASAGVTLAKYIKNRRNRNKQ